MLGILPLAKGRTTYSLPGRIMLVISHFWTASIDDRFLLFTQTQSHPAIGVEDWGRQGESFQSCGSSYSTQPSWEATGTDLRSLTPWSSHQFTALNPTPNASLSAQHLALLSDSFLHIPSLSVCPSLSVSPRLLFSLPLTHHPLPLSPRKFQTYIKIEW